MAMMQLIATGEVREIDPATIPPHKLALWQAYTPPQPPSPPPEPAPPTLDEWKKILCAGIDAAAEVERLKYITGGSGQALEYQEAAEEAARYVATGGAGAYPMLQASVSAGEAADLASAAALIGARENAWASIGAAIRQKRIAAKLAVKAAADHTSAEAAAVVVWP